MLCSLQSPTVLSCSQMWATELKDIWFYERSQSKYKFKYWYLSQSTGSRVFFSLLDLPVLCERTNLKTVGCCLVKMLFFKSHLGLFGTDLSFIVGLSFVWKLIPLCPHAHKSPDIFFSLHFEPRGSNRREEREMKRETHSTFSLIASFFLHLTFIFSSPTLVLMFLSPMLSSVLYVPTQLLQGLNRRQMGFVRQQVMRLDNAWAKQEELLIAPLNS